MLMGLFLVTASSAHADPTAVEGTWLSGDGDGLIEVRVVGSEISATILGPAVENPERAKTDLQNPDPELRDRELIGLELFQGFQYDGDGEWSGGSIYDPNSGKTYRCNLKLTDHNTLKVRGFIGISLLGRTETWIRQPD
jgi:uncharacterized protein (DUF2147 family)